MEISTSPHRPATTPWGRLLALVVVLAPVCMLVLLPIGLGLERYVMSGSSMAGDRTDSIPRGSVVFERPVAVDELRAGDVITFPRPSGADGAAEGGGMVTHRIVSIDEGGIVTQGDAEAAPDPWVLQPGRSALPRVVFTVPWLGFVYQGLAAPAAWLLLAGGVGLVVLVFTSGARRTRRTPATSAGVGAGSQR